MKVALFELQHPLKVLDEAAQWGLGDGQKRTIATWHELSLSGFVSTLCFIVWFLKKNKFFRSNTLSTSHCLLFFSHSLIFYLHVLVTLTSYILILSRWQPTSEVCYTWQVLLFHLLTHPSRVMEFVLDPPPACHHLHLFTPVPNLSHC